MKGQYDLFNGFVERGVEVLKNHGLLGFIIPSRFIKGPHYATFRKFLLDHTSILELCDVGEDIFEGVEMPALIAIFRKESKAHQRDRTQIEVKVDVEDLTKCNWTTYKIPQKRFREEQDYLFTIYQTEEMNQITRKMETNALLFRDVVHNARGVEIGKRSPLVSEHSKSGYVPFLVGEDIDRYAILNHRYLKLGDKTVDYKSPALYQEEKILIRKTGTGINATYDDQGFYVIQVIYIFTKKDPKINLKYLLGLLNSRLLAFYYYGKFGERTKKAFPHLRQDSILKLPIQGLPHQEGSNAKLHDTVVTAVETLLKLHNELNDIPSDYDRYITEPIIGQIAFREYYSNLDVSNKEALDKVSKGTVRKITVDEEDEWLTFFIDYDSVRRGTKTSTQNIPIVRCKFADPLLRKFLLFSVNNYKKAIGTGNLLDKILSIRLPIFSQNSQKNLKLIHQMMSRFVEALNHRETLEKTINETENKINSSVYRVYNLSPQEITLVESFFN
jgi:hypothetical protein